MADLRRAFLANTVYSGAATYLEYGATLISSIVIARHLGPEEYGTYTLLLWLTTMGAVLSNNGVITAVMKFVGEARGRGAPAVVAALLRYFERRQLICLAFISPTIAAAIVVAGDRIAGTGSGELLWILLPAVALRSLYVYYSSAAKGFEDFRALSVVQWTVAPVSVATVAALAWAGAALPAFVWAYAAACLLSATSMRAALRRHRARPETDAALADLMPRIRHHVRYASAIVVFDLLVLRQTELLFLDRFSTRENVAYYGLGRSLAANALLLVPGVMTALLLPLMARTFGESQGMLRDRFLATTRYLSLVTMPVVVLCVVFAEAAVAALYGPAYGPAIVVFRVAIGAGAIGVVSASASSYQLSTDRQPAIVAIMAAVTAVTLALDYVLIRRFALGGAIVAGATGAILLGVGLLCHAYRSLGATLDWRTAIGIICAGGVSAIVPAMTMGGLPLWLALPSGILVVLAAYLPSTILFGAWTRDDLRSLHGLQNRVPRSLWKPALAFIRWAEHFGARPAAH